MKPSDPIDPGPDITDALSAIISIILIIVFSVALVALAHTGLQFFAAVVGSEYAFVTISLIFIGFLAVAVGISRLIEKHLE